VKILGVDIGKNNNHQANTENGKAKGYIYRCAVSCTYNGKFYREGDTLVLSEKKEIPHFNPVEKGE